MDTAALAYPLLRRAAVGLHGFVGGWILLNGAAHSLAVWWKDRQGTLAPHHDAGHLLWMGAALLLAGALLAGSWPALSRGGLMLPLGALGVFATVIAGIARVYGFNFLGGSISLLTLDLAFLLSNRALNG